MKSLLRTLGAGSGREKRQGKVIAEAVVACNTASLLRFLAKIFMQPMLGVQSCSRDVGDVVRV